MTKNQSSHEQLKENIVQTVKRQKPETAKELIKLIQQTHQLPEKEIVKLLIELENENKFHFTKQEPPTPPSATFDLYVVPDQATWTNGMTIPARVLGSATSVTSDSSGNIAPTTVWASATLGTYDIVVDVNKNGHYDAGLDALDNNDVVTTAGLLVVPEYMFGGLLALAACFAAFVVFKRPHFNLK